MDFKGDADISDGRIEVDGAGEGSWTARLDCDGTGTLEVSKDGTGAGTVEIRDGAGEEVFDQTFSGTGRQDHSSDVDGVPGRWTLDLATTGSFTGDFEVLLTC